MRDLKKSSIAPWIPKRSNYICIETVHIPKGFYGGKMVLVKKCMLCKILGFLLSSFETSNTLSSFLLLGSID